MRPGVERTLFVSAGGVAGLLASLPAIHALGRTYPRARHEVLTVAAGAELLAADPFVDSVHVSPSAEIAAACERLLAAGRYDLVVSPPPAAVRPMLGAVRIEENSALYGRGIVDAHALGDGRMFLTAAERAAARRLRSGGTPLVAVFVGADCAEWPDEHIAAAARALWRRGADIVIVPAAPEARATAIAAAIAPGVQVWPPGPLRELAARLAQTDLALGADVALCRLAAAVGTPTIELWAAPLLDAADVLSEAERMLGTRLSREKASSRAVDLDHELGRDRELNAHCKLGYDRHGKLGHDRELDVDRKVDRKLGLDRELECHPTAAMAARGAVPSPQPLRRLGLAILRRRTRDDAWRRARRLLVVRADNIGDVIMTGPALRAIKRTLPDCSLTLLASPSGAMAAPLLPWVQHTIAWRVLWQELHGRPADPASERRLVATLQARRFDGVIVLTSFSQSPHAPACAAWLAGIPLRAGASDAHGYMLTHALPKGDLGRHQACRNLDLVRSLGFDTDDDSLEIRVPDGARCGAAALLAAHGVPAGQPYLLVSPWASIEARTYDGNRLARAAKLISAAAGMPLVVTGHKRDAAKAALLTERMGPAAIDLCRETSVTELAALVARARLVLANNTSVMHLADALGTPAVVIYSGTDLESQWAPRRTPHRLLRKPTTCSPCYAFTCPLDRACMDIEPADVADAALTLLSAAGRNA